MAKTKLKQIRMTDQMIESIKDVREEFGFLTETQTILFLIHNGIQKVLPPYLKKPKKTETEKAIEKKQAEEFAEKKAFEKENAKIDYMMGQRVNRDGFSDAYGQYVKYKTYSYLPGNPPRIAITEVKNPITLIDVELERQFEGASREEILNLIENGVEGTDWIKFI